jgi:hypothetical protein
MAPLSYGWKKRVEVYYAAQRWQSLHAAIDYQSL